MTSLPVIVYQGEPGAYSEAAAHELLGENIKCYGQDTFEKCFQALEDGKADFAMMPIENSMGGSVHDCFDLQLKYDFNIVAELDFRVRHCLMALEGSKIEDIKAVISHPQALAQCDNYLRANSLKPKKEYDTAGSAKKIWDEKLIGYAAIASELAAKTNKLTILDNNIEDDPNNVTRFFLLSKKCLQPPKYEELLKVEDLGISYKTSVVMTFRNIPGALSQALSCCSTKGIDLTKIESRPNRLKKRGRFLPETLPTEILEVIDKIQYRPLHSTNQSESESSSDTDSFGGIKSRYPFVFYVDLIGSITETRVVSALKELCSFCVFFRVLGSYPRGGVLQQFVAKSVGSANNAQLSSQSEQRVKKKGNEEKIKIALVGFGNFGQFLAKTFVAHHEVVACNRSDASDTALALGVKYFKTPVEMLESEKDVQLVVFCVAILAFEKVFKTIPADLLNNKLLVDVLSVKVFPKELLTSSVKDYGVNSGVLCTHPMFGPESGKYTWKGLPMVYEDVLFPNSGEISDIKDAASAFLNIFSREGCRMVNMTCEEHDIQAADSQFITHFMGRLVGKLDLNISKDKSKEISTTGFKSLKKIRDHTIMDSFNLFAALYLYNPNSEKTIEKLKAALSELLNDLSKKRQELQYSSTNPSNIFEVTDLVKRLIGSKTGEMFALAKRLKQEGHDIVMSMCVGEPDYQCPKAVIDATIEAANLGLTKYTPVQGDRKLRIAIADYLKNSKHLEYIPENILVTHSGKQALLLVILALVSSGDEVVIPAPYWTSYPDLVRFAGGTVKIVDRDPMNGFIMSPKQLKMALTPKTKMLVLNNPCNPTGCVYSKEQLLGLAEVLQLPENQHVVVLADDIYEKLVFWNDPHCSFAELPGMKKRTILVNGFSKGYAMTGYRLGYLAGEPSVVKACTKLQSQINSCANSIAQHAGIAALTKVPEEELEPLRAELMIKRDLCLEKLKEIPNIFTPIPNGAFYAFPDVSHYIGQGIRTKNSGELIVNTTDLCMYLMKEFGVALVAGDAFGAPYGIRLSFATSKTDIVEAVKRLKSGLESLVII